MEAKGDKKISFAPPPRGWLGSPSPAGLTIFALVIKHDVHFQVPVLFFKLEGSTGDQISIGPFICTGMNIMRNPNFPNLAPKFNSK